MSQGLSLGHLEIHILGVRSMNSLRTCVPNIVFQLFGSVSSCCEAAEHSRVCVPRLESEMFRICVWNVRPLNMLRGFVFQDLSVWYLGICVESVKSLNFL